MYFGKPSYEDQTLQNKLNVMLAVYLTKGRIYIHLTWLQKFGCKEVIVLNLGCPIEIQKEGG